MPSMVGATAKGSWGTLPGGWAAERVGSQQPTPLRRENKQEAGLKEEKGVGTMGLKPERLGRTSSRGGREILTNQKQNRKEINICTQIFHNIMYLINRKKYGLLLTFSLSLTFCLKQPICLLLTFCLYKMIYLLLTSHRSFNRRVFSVKFSLKISGQNLHNMKPGEAEQYPLVHLYTCAHTKHECTLSCIGRNMSTLVRTL